LAQIIAHEMGAKIHITSGPSLERPSDLAGTLVQLEAGDVLFIDEIHRVSPQLEEFLYPAMEDRKLDILIESGGKPQSVRIDLAAFTMIGATTKPGNLTAPLRGRFQTIHRLELYSVDDLAEIVLQSAKKLSVKLEPDAAHEIALRSRGTPRTANNNLLWARDFARSELDSETITAGTAKTALEEIGITPDGLDETDRKILKALCQTFQGGPVGVASLAVASGEDATSIEDIHEPYLIAQGYIQRTAQGRVALEKARALHPGAVKPKEEQGALL
jgi:Holliday junction DNA helicase RuvB